jgi:two-component system, chemotaxis family, sensor kinase CheA
VEGSDDRRARRLATFRALTDERVGRLNLAWIQLEQSPQDAARADVILRDLHTLKGEASLMGFGAMAELVHVLEEVVRTVSAGATSPPAALGDAVLEALDKLVALGAQNPVPAGDPAVAALVATLHARTKVTATTPTPPQPTAPDTTPPPPTPPPPQAPPPQITQPIATVPAAPREAEAASVRVRAEQLDRVRDIVGELLLTRIRLDGSATGLRQLRDAATPDDIEEIERALRDDIWRMANLVGALEEVTRELRMVAIAELFARVPRVVRSLAQQLGRQVTVIMGRESAEVDREILEALDEPLLHLLRNAVDHGIEPPEVRTRAGKSPTGTIRLSGEVTGDVLRVEIADDGAGIDVERVRQRALELGQVAPTAAAAMSRDELLQLLFLSRMTTRETVTEISGRGVGLDVVRDKLTALGGAVQLTSTLGRGTTFIITAPVASSLKPVVLFYVGDARFAIPASSIESILLTSDVEQQDSVYGAAVLYNEQVIPQLDLRVTLGEEALGRLTGVRYGRTIIARSGVRRIALTGTFAHQQRVAMIKSSALFREDGLISGGVALEDGTIALALNVARLADEVLGTTRGPTPVVTTTGLKHTVLVVDDSPLILDLIVEALRAHGLTVLEATNGIEALAELDRHPEVDLVVTDLEMPRMDGLELIRAMRARKVAKRVPAIVVSTRGSDQDKHAAMSVGADAYLVKSDFSNTSLWSVVQPFLR